MCREGWGGGLFVCLVFFTQRFLGVELWLLMVCITMLRFVFLIHLQKTEGVGQLLFEMMKGVKEHFHTISGQVSIYYRCLCSILCWVLSDEM